MEKVKNVDQYINNFPKNIQDKLNELRRTIKKAVPKAEEKISYAIPSYYYYGRLVYFAAWKKHVAIYGIFSTAREMYKNELKGYAQSKGTIKFPLTEELPLSLVEKLVKAQAIQNEKISKD